MGHACRRVRGLLLGHLSLHAPSNRGSRARLLAAMVRMKRDRTRSTPRYMVCGMPPTVLAQPNGSSIFFRRFWDNAYPSCRVVRPSIAEYLDFWAMWGVTQAWRRSDTLSPSLPADLAALITPAGALALLRLDVYGPASRLPILSRIAEITGHLARLLHGGLNDVQGEP